ncbi:DUF177 domain-containing protein [uncultured Tateyamaria sp.]|uniref:YceD family protein n=1 Tax=uncultured Tateyamaria sp. TaxID=455651 RepID=UPI00260A57D5|nr:DUF177 domain-containing protein [uncultured Tateyamaria sp.]
MAMTPPSRTALRVADLAQNAGTGFEIVPDAAALKAMAEMLDLTGLRKVRFVGEVRAQGAADWLLSGKLGATVTQPCGVTLAPVTTRIDVPVRRVYLRDFSDDFDDPEVEMPEDDEVEALGPWIDPEAVLTEALSLAVPDYPRAEGVALGETVLTEPGKAPLTDEAVRPFAGLADLKAKLDKDAGE